MALKWMSENDTTANYVATSYCDRVTETEQRAQLFIFIRMILSICFVDQSMLLLLDNVYAYYKNTCF